MTHTPPVQQIDALLPQTQCTQCGYDGCLPYAQAIACKGEQINRCPPGGDQGIAALAKLLGPPELPLNTDCGTPRALHVAVIDEAHCIGCTLCIQACPVDAIVGANKLMHTVLADRCTGCDLCIAPCPVDCITMVPAGHDWTPDHAAQAREHHRQRQQRLASAHAEHSGPAARVLANKAPVAQHAAHNPAHKQHAISQALQRARERRAARQTNEGSSE
jgi:electron transport complex protein RnfB